jgi:hypothetical protein
VQLALLELEPGVSQAEVEAFDQREYDVTSVSELAERRQSPTMPSDLLSHLSYTRS